MKFSIIEKHKFYRGHLVQGKTGQNHLNNLKLTIWSTSLIGWWNPYPIENFTAFHKPLNRIFSICKLILMNTFIHFISQNTLPPLKIDQKCSIKWLHGGARYSFFIKLNEIFNKGHVVCSRLSCSLCKLIQLFLNFATKT